jgi:hypothetical protein
MARKGAPPGHEWALVRVVLQADAKKIPLSEHYQSPGHVGAPTDTAVCLFDAHKFQAFVARREELAAGGGRRAAAVTGAHRKRRRVPVEQEEEEGGAAGGSAADASSTTRSGRAVRLRLMLDL